MKDMKIRSMVVKNFLYYSEKSISDEKENFLNRDFTTTGVNQKRRTDITYIPIVEEGSLSYISNESTQQKDTFMTVELAVKAVENACMIARHNIHSFGWRGNLNNNACIESFHSLLIKEKNHQIYTDFNTARKAVFEYTNFWYNQKRIHNVIIYMNPKANNEAT